MVYLTELMLDHTEVVGSIEEQLDEVYYQIGVAITHLSQIQPEDTHLVYVRVGEQ